MDETCLHVKKMNDHVTIWPFNMRVNGEAPAFEAGTHKIHASWEPPSSWHSTCKSYDTDIYLGLITLCAADQHIKMETQSVWLESQYFIRHV